MDTETARANLEGALGDLDELVERRPDLASTIQEVGQLLKTAQNRLPSPGRG